ncbi:hydrogenase formation protein HypD [Candidatus Poribacteria bacterium]|nr:hydrogenase formation protein HypD [Candidatus Poribacteria bacterium]
MKNKFNQLELTKKILSNIVRLIHRKYNFMEVCGTHTMAIAKYGLRSLLPDEIKLLSGPGCPVCVTPVEIIDSLIDLSSDKKIIIATFGDMIKVPGSKSSLEESRSLGAKIKIVYSPFELIRFANSNKDKEIVFAGVGFETTSPTVAACVKRAHQEKIKNLSILTAFKLVPPALKAILENPKINIDGFILPGHVSTIIGTKFYKFIPQKYNIPGVVSGFEPVDILLSILYLLEQHEKKEYYIKNEYAHAGVTEDGNNAAISLLEETFTVKSDNWRAIGIIPDSGLFLRKEFLHFDACEKFKLTISTKKPQTKCICGNILLGLCLPPDCRLFGNQCTPSKPVGPCMVSSEGACAAFYKYRK